MARTGFFIYPKDIQVITGRSERYAQNVIASIKKKLGKQKHQPVTVIEFCEYMDISLQDLRGYLEEA
jgi:hypothetical protein